jgi:peptidyl-tRNA hydrolase
MNWPLGSIVAQGCHAATAALWLSKDQPITQTYCAPENIDHMHKVVLEATGDAQIRDIAQKLEEAGILHKLWIEQPEDFVTCLATAPYPKSIVAPFMKKLKLCKGT